MDLVLVNGGGVVGDEVDATDLLEHLVHVRQHGAVEVAVLALCEEFAEAALGRFQDGVFDGGELGVDVGVVAEIYASEPILDFFTCRCGPLPFKIIQCTEDVERFVLPSLENEPSR